MGEAHISPASLTSSSYSSMRRSAGRLEMSTVGRALEAGVSAKGEGGRASGLLDSFVCVRAWRVRIVL